MKDIDKFREFFRSMGVDYREMGIHELEPPHQEDDADPNYYVVSDPVLTEAIEVGASWFHFDNPSGKFRGVDSDETGWSGRVGK
jgi:hypothetical protein